MKDDALRIHLDMRADEMGIEFMILDDFDEAIVGLTLTTNGEPHLVYDTEQIIHALMQNGIEDEEDAWEYFSFNIEGLSPNRGGPLFIERF